MRSTSTRQMEGTTPNDKAPPLTLSSFLTEGLRNTIKTETAVMNTRDCYCCMIDNTMCIIVQINNVLPL